MGLTCGLLPTTLLLWALTVGAAAVLIDAMQQQPTAAEDCTGRGARLAKLREEISVVKATLQLVQRRVTQLREDNRQTAARMNNGMPETDQEAKRADVPLRSRRYDQTYCTNMRDRVRLVNGTTTTGRVEVLVGTQWSPVSQTYFTETDAGIVCNSLGHYGSNVLTVTHDVFGEGDQDLLVDESCRRSVGVLCGSPDYQIRLVDGSHPHRGRVEIAIAGQWGTVCQGSNWNSRTAKVVCHKLGYDYQYGSLAVGRGYFGQGDGPTWLSNFNCQGTETDPLSCSTDTLIPTGCGHTNDVGVICDSWMQYHVRLANGSVATEGRVEVEVDGVWGTVSANSWDDSDAKVVCGMLGYTDTHAISAGGGSFGAGTGPVWLDQVECSGVEDHILQCFSRLPLLPSRSASHSLDAGVACNATSLGGSIRLVNGSTVSEGRIEIQINGQWGIVCDDSWDVLDAKVVCRQLGLASSNATPFIQAHFGQGTLPILMDEVNCIGTENHLLNCGFPGVGINDCGPAEAAGVACR